MNKEQINSNYYSKVAARATTLQDKINEPQRFSFHPANNQLLEQRLTLWRNIVAPNDSTMFENRLKNDGITEDDLKNLLGTVSYSNEDQHPLWVESFREIMQFLALYNPSDLSEEMTLIFGPEKNKNIPFLYLLTPLVAYATHKLDKVAGVHKKELFSTSAEQMLHTQLALQLAHYSLQTFQLEFNVYNSLQQSSLSRFIEQLNREVQPEDKYYQQFIKQIMEDGWKDFFAEYSVLAKIITIAISNWINNSANFILRFSNDLSDITNRFADGVLPGLLLEYKGDISDSHDGGKGVISLKFESGLKLVYKPKNLELEKAWSELLIWINEKGLKPDLKPVNVILRKGYGWVGFIEHFECTTEQEVVDYYRRIGALIGIIYLLNGNDCHIENLIASGAYPMLIDFESVLHHEAKPFAEVDADNAMFFVNKLLRKSVYRTGLLPNWIKGKDGFLYDISGIGGYGNGKSPFMSPKWDNINTDLMKLTFFPASFIDLNNLPVFNGQQQKPIPYSDDIVSGFTTFYKLAILHRNEFPIHLFAKKELRFILRSTRIYGLVLKKMANPKYLRTGIEWGIQTEQLIRAFLHTPTPNPYWPINKSELRQIEEMDIPIFWADSNKTDLKDKLGIVSANLMCNAAYDEVKSNFEEIDENDLKKQVRLIRAALFFKELDHDSALGDKENYVRDIDNVLPINKDMLLDSAMKIARTLQAEAIFSKDGSCTWLSVGIIGSNRYRIQPMSMFLYDGIPGVALFLSALYTVNADPEIKRLLDGTIKSLRHVINNMQQYRAYANTSSIGITSGISSVIYSLLKIATFLNDPSFIEDAEKVSTLLTPVMIQNDHFLDISSGSAGCLLGMLALYNHSNHSEHLEKAILCGDHLLKNVTENSDGSCGWKTSGAKMLSGFSHGQSGIAHALLKLYEVTGNNSYRNIAEQAIKYENTLFYSEQCNWKDLRVVDNQKESAPYCMVSWCHGAPGIGLSRLSSLHLLNDPSSANTDIANAIVTTQKAAKAMLSRDHVCCGNMSLADILLHFAHKTGDQSLALESAELTAKVIHDAEKHGHFNILLGSDGDFSNPGFFQGITGIGYSLLRQAFPDKFPCILIFE